MFSEGGQTTDPGNGPGASLFVTLTLMTPLTYSASGIHSVPARVAVIDAVKVVVTCFVFHLLSFAFHVVLTVLTDVVVCELVRVGGRELGVTLT